MRETRSSRLASEVCCCKARQLHGTECVLPFQFCHLISIYLQYHCAMGHSHDSRNLSARLSPARDESFKESTV